MKTIEWLNSNLKWIDFSVDKNKHTYYCTYAWEVLAHTFYLLTVMLLGIYLYFALHIEAIFEPTSFSTGIRNATTKDKEAVLSVVLFLDSIVLFITLLFLSFTYKDSKVFIFIGKSLSALFKKIRLFLWMTFYPLSMLLDAIEKLYHLVMNKFCRKIED